MAEQNESLRAQAAKGGKWTAISAVAGITLQMAQLMVMGRLLEPADFGLMAMMMVVIGLASAIADFGLGNYLVQADKLSQNALHKLLATVLVLSTVLGGVVVLTADTVAAYYKAPQLSNLLPWLAVVIVATTMSQMLFALLQRDLAFKAIAVGEIGAAFATLLATVTVALAGYGVWALVAGQLVAGVSRFLLFLPAFQQSRKRLPKKTATDLHQAKGFALFQTAERGLNYLGWNLDKLILGRMVGDVGLGIYTVAYQLMVRPFSVLNPIFTRVALPLFSSIKNDDKRLISGYLQTLRIVAFLSFPVYLLFSIAAPTVIFVVMGEKWAESAPVLSILSVLGMFFSIGNPVGTLILAKGKPNWAFYINLFSLVVYALAFTIGARFGVLGMAWGFLVAGATILYPMEFYLRYKLVGMGIREYFQALSAVFIAAGIPLFAYGLLYFFDFGQEQPLVSFISGMFAVVFFYFYLWVFDKPLIINVKNLILKGI